MFSSLPRQDVPPSKEKAPKFMGLVGEAVELIPQDVIQLQRVDYLDVIAVIPWKKCGKCVLFMYRCWCFRMVEFSVRGNQQCTSEI